MHRHFQNPAKHLKWSQKGLPAKIIIAYNMSHKDLNTIKRLNMSRVLDIPGIEKLLNM